MFGFFLNHSQLLVKGRKLPDCERSAGTSTCDRGQDLDPSNFHA